MHYMVINVTANCPDDDAAEVDWARSLHKTAREAIDAVIGSHKISTDSRDELICKLEEIVPGGILRFRHTDAEESLILPISVVADSMMKLEINDPGYILGAELEEPDEPALVVRYAGSVGAVKTAPIPVTKSIPKRVMKGRK